MDRTSPSEGEDAGSIPAGGKNELAVSQGEDYLNNRPMDISQRKFAGIVLFFFVAVFAGVAGYAWLNAQKQLVTREIPTTHSPTPTTWKTYRNERFGFAFQYPAQINGKPVSVTQRKDARALLLFQSTIPYGSPGEGKGGELVQPHVSNQVILSVTPFGEFSYPEPKGKMYAPMLTVGVDLGGQGGYIYDPSKDRWHSRRNVLEELDWSGIYAYLRGRVPAESIVRTASGYSAFPYGGEAYEDHWGGYRIFSAARRLFLDFGYSYGYAPDSIKDEAEKENSAVHEFLRGVVKTVVFF